MSDLVTVAALHKVYCWGGRISAVISVHTHVHATAQHNDHWGPTVQADRVGCVGLMSAVLCCVVQVWSPVRVGPAEQLVQADRV